MNIIHKRLFFSVLTTSLLITAVAWAQESGSERASGVVEPKVSVIMHKIAMQSPLMLNYDLPTGISLPNGIAVDSKDRIWMSLMAANSIGVLNPETNQYKEYRIPSTVGLVESDWVYDSRNRTMPETSPDWTNYSVGHPGTLIVDGNDVVWFVLQMGNSLARFDPVKEEFTEFMMPVENSLPYDLAADSKGRIWFVAKNTGKIGYLDPEKEKMVEFQMPEGSNIMGIVVDSQDKVWISETFGNYIGRFDPDTKRLKKFPITTDLAQPGQLKFDLQGRLWVTLTTAKQIGVLMMDSGKGIFAVQDMPGYNAVPRSIAVGKDGLIWVVDNMMNRVGYFDPEKIRWNFFSIPAPDAQPMNITVDSKGDLWFTQSQKNANRVARIVRSTVTLEKKTISESSKKSLAAGKALATEGSSGKLVAVAVVVAFVLLIGGFAVVALRKKN